MNYIDYHIISNKKLSQEELKNSILRYTETIRYGKHGYIWIHDTNYYLLAHPFRQDSLNTYDIELKDPKGTYITKKFIDKTIEHPSGAFVEYYWQKPGEEHFSSKLGYFRLHEKYNWVIGAGLYMDDIQNSIIENKKLLEDRINKYIRLVVLISFIVIFFIGFISFLMSKKITQVFRNYQNNVQKKSFYFKI